MCSTSSTAWAAPIAGVPEPGSAWRSAAASSRRWAARITAGNRTDRPGATFTITLPVLGRGEATPAEEAWHDRWCGALRVLVVDDEPAILRFLRAGLRQPGLRRRRGGGRTGGVGRRAAAARRPDRAGPRAAGHRWPRGDPPHSRGWRSADHRAVQPRRRGGEGGSARPRRRRLRDQAVRHRRTVGAHPRRTAPPAAAGRRAAGVPQPATSRSIWCGGS